VCPLSGPAIGPLLCILGGKQLYRGEDYVVSLKEPEQCIAKTLAAIDADWLRAR
jgi:hypothetical protein